jgi:ATP-binding cassette subfamily C (CFTR/MRP) protein 1
MQISRTLATANLSSSALTHTFCHNSEGWGPLSLIRYDFTPCFLDVPYAAVALFGITLGAATIWHLLERKSKQPTEKDWHYFAKLVCSKVQPESSLQI